MPQASSATRSSKLATAIQEAELARLGYAFLEEPQSDLTLLSTTERVQVREADNYAHRDEVASYAAQMSQSVFPPIIKTLDNVLVDGNTRKEASLARGDRFFPALVIQENYLTATEKRQVEFRMLAATLNNQNGRRQEPREARKTLADALKLNWRVEQIVRALGVKPADIHKVKYEVDAHDRLAKVGLSNGQVTAAGASLRALGKPMVLALNHEPYRALAQLAMDAGLNTGEILALAKDAKATGSDEAALAHIAGVRQENAERIRTHALVQPDHGASKPPIARQLRQHLGFVVNNGENPAGLVETNPPTMQMHLDRITAAIDVLSAVRIAQMARIADSGTAEPVAV